MNGSLRGLQCRFCELVVEMPEFACPACRGPLDAAYDWDSISVSRPAIEAGPLNLWRYAPLLPASANHPAAGWTPLVDAPLLAAQLGIERLLLKLESAHFPQRHARLKAVATAAAEARGLDVARDWLRLMPYAAEGAKTVAFEIAEQLGWRFPSAVVAPVATGRLLVKLGEGFDELERVGLITGTPPRLVGAGPRGATLDGTDGELVLATASAVRGALVFVPLPLGIHALLQVTREAIRAGTIARASTTVLVVTGPGPTTSRDVSLLVDRTNIVM